MPLHARIRIGRWRFLLCRRCFSGDAWRPKGGSQAGGGEVALQTWPSGPLLRFGNPEPQHGPAANGSGCSSLSTGHE